MKARAVFLALPLLVLAGYLYERRAEARASGHFPPPGERIDIRHHNTRHPGGGRQDGGRLHLVRMGERVPGRPTVILEAGHADWSGCWHLVQPEVARFARVIAYDRAGLGWSDPGPLPRSPEAIVSELHSLLERAGETGPYLLVGHSLGAAFCRLYAARYPEEVVGMVWVDSAHEDMDRHIPFWPAAYWGILAAARLGGGLARLGLVRLLGARLALLGYPSSRTPRQQAEVSNLVAGPRFFDTMYAETIGWRNPAGWQHHAPGSAPGNISLPITLLEAQYPSGAPATFFRPFWEQYLSGWRAIQDDLCRSLDHARRIPVASGHVIPGEQPGMVVQAIKEMLEMLA